MRCVFWPLISDNTYKVNLAANRIEKLGEGQTYSTWADLVRFCPKSIKHMDVFIYLSTLLTVD